MRRPSSTPVDRSIRRIAPVRVVLAVTVALTGGWLAAGCDQWALQINGGTGLVLITVIDDGSGAGGYRVRARQAGVPDRIVEVPPGRELRLEAAGTGPVELTLLAPAECRVTGPNPQHLLPAADRTVRASFALACAGAP